MVQVPTPAPNEQIPLFGYERFYTIGDNGSAVIATPMLLQGSHAGAIDALVAGLEVAVLRTFNKHPRMRTKQVKGEFALAEIHPSLTLEVLQEHKLLEVRVVDSSDEFRNTWSEYVEKQCNIAFNRYAQFPYYVRVWHCPALNQARVMLFADHYMSDGMSGIFVLNDIVSIASKLSREKLQDLAPADQVSNPLRPSLYDQWLRPQGRVRLWFTTLLIKMFGKMVYKHELKHFSPIIPVRADQADFMIPPKVNSSSAFFANGNKADMVAALQRCKEEGVTFFGAISAAVAIAYYLTSDSKSKNEATEPFKFNLGLDYNMRKRVEAPMPEDPVGAFMTTCDMEKFSKEGVLMHSTAFWDLARSLKQEADDIMESALMPLQMLFVHERVNAETKPDFAIDMPIPQSFVCDANISSIGKYPFPLTHVVQKGDDNDDVSVHIESVHVLNSLPHMAVTMFYVASTDQVNYSMMYKYENDTAQKLFKAFTTTVDHIGQIDKTQKLVDVAQQVQTKLTQ
ncbi:hypothetical protein FI667_g9941, partial [Globisporangium splendens]